MSIDYSQTIVTYDEAVARNSAFVYLILNTQRAFMQWYTLNQTNLDAAFSVAVPAYILYCIWHAYSVWKTTGCPTEKKRIKGELDQMSYAISELEKQRAKLIKQLVAFN
jgi:predicted HAD superfamily hydrolase